MNLNKFQHPDINDNMRNEIDKIIDFNRGDKGAVITVLRKCQKVVGYLPVTLIDYISLSLNLPASEVFGVATFYSLFSLKPKGKHTIKVCTGTACYVKGTKEIINRIDAEYGIKEGETSKDRRFSLDCVRCLGACGLAPAMVIDDKTYGGLTPDKAIEKLQEYN
jgi:NADH:ubiquinone oxidoreductase subunit E